MPSFSPNTLSQLLPVVYPLPYHGDFPVQSTVGDSSSVDEEDSIIIPAGHHTTTSSLFTLPSIRSLIGDYSPSLFYEIESSRAWDPPFYFGQEVSEVLGSLDLSIETTVRLIASFFTNIHPKYPLLDQESFPDFFQRTLQQDCRDQSDLAVCLLVLALGELGSTEDPIISFDNDHAGMPYFGLAYRILTTHWVGSFGARLSTPLGLVLAAVYCSFKACPLPAWRLSYLASNTLQLLVNRSVSP